MKTLSLQGVFFMVYFNVSCSSVKVDHFFWINNMMEETEVKLDNDNKILITYQQEVGYAETRIRCFRTGEENKRQNLLDIIEACQKELEVIYELG